VNFYAKSGQPFLISLHFNAPHWPWEAPGDEAESKRVAGTNLRDFDGGTQKTYQRMIEAMDAQIGRVLDALDANGLTENTIVISPATTAVSVSLTLGHSPARRPNCWKADYGSPW
jgi:arylsulfatase A-like enzyme